MPGKVEAHHAKTPREKNYRTGSRTSFSRPRLFLSLSFSPCSLAYMRERVISGRERGMHVFHGEEHSVGAFFFDPTTGVISLSLFRFDPSSINAKNASGGCECSSRFIYIMHYPAAYRESFFFLRERYRFSDFKIDFFPGENSNGS